GDGDAVLHAGRRDPFAGGEGAVDRLSLLGLEPALGDEKVDHLGDRLPLVAGLEVRDDLTLLEEVSQLHDSSSLRWDSSSAIFVRWAASFSSISRARSGFRLRNSSFESCFSACAVCSRVFSTSFFVRSISAFLSILPSSGT